MSKDNNEEAYKAMETIAELWDKAIPMAFEMANEHGWEKEEFMTAACICITSMQIACCKEYDVSVEDWRRMTRAIAILEIAKSGARSTEG